MNLDTPSDKFFSALTCGLRNKFFVAGKCIVYETIKTNPVETIVTIHAKDKSKELQLKNEIAKHFVTVHLFLNDSDSVFIYFTNSISLTKQYNLKNDLINMATDITTYLLLNKNPDTFDA